MMSSSTDYKKYELGRQLVLLATLLFLFAIIGGVSEGRAPVSSSETRFVETSTNGMRIVPASCPSIPSNPDFPHDTCSTSIVGITTGPNTPTGGTTGGSCVPTSVCSGVRLVNSCTGEEIAACSPSCIEDASPHNFCIGRDVYHQSSPCVVAYVRTCSAPQSAGCSWGQCLPPPPPASGFEPFDATSPAGAFTSNGHLEIRPRLVRSGEHVQLYWNVKNADSCTVTGTNGDAWTVAGTGASFISSSGSAGKTTGVISNQTTYTLDCTSVPDAVPATIHETLLVNVIASFEENCQPGFVHVNGQCVAE